jgi:pimeloyl-ACP methyl ester carboxylesterase
MFVREAAGPPGAPALLLLHGWGASGGLNWFRVFEPLGRRFRVIAPDLRGHARGIRSSRFRLEDCADDCAALLDALGIERAIAGGYSMGGAVAQLLWRRHPERVAGLVLCATGPLLISDARHREVFGAALGRLAPLVRLTSAAALLARVAPASGVPPLLAPLALAPLALVPHELARWAALEMARHDLRMLIEAGQAIHRHDATGWIHRIDTPTAVVVTTRDRGLDPRVQREMAERIPRASLHLVDGGHVACARSSFAAPFSAAVEDVAARLN